MSNYNFIKIRLVALTLFLSLSVVAQTDFCSLAPRFDQEVFPNVNVTSDVVFGSNVDYQGDTVQLTMDIYQPDGDTLTQRPVIVWVHGGSFLGGTKNDMDVTALCNQFAKRGYVTASINYRLGMVFPPNQTKATQAVYRAVQDMKAAIRFLRKDAATNNLYQIDSTLIFGGGSSAGAFTSIHLAYLNDVNELPPAIDTTLLGNLDGESGNPGYGATISAVLNLCGAIGDSSWIIENDIPIASMHGTNDNTVPYGHSMLTIAVFFQIMIVDGSHAIHDHIFARLNNVNQAMYTWAGADHVPYAGTSPTAIAYMDTTVRFVSNFLYQYLGCSPIDPNPLPNTFSTTDLPHTNAIQPIVLYPNPTQNNLSINTLSLPATITIHDLLGNRVGSYSITDFNSILPVNDLPKGAYSLTLNYQNQFITKKFIKY
ncbi:MAG: hypothetical protein RIQ89_1313 [Bacteroidota bacterium]|jgi:para-nitrobenzyl esterase